MSKKRVKLPSGKTIEVDEPEDASGAEACPDVDAPPLNRYFIQRSEGILYTTTDLNTFEKKVQLRIESGEQGPRTICGEDVEGDLIWVGYEVFSAGELELLETLPKSGLSSEE